ncbi:hypothetical protein BDK92_7238 [Micromonospora pisi]|uniref:Heme exporter protein D n=1 Tax=Micromonospora pisi TaxID=589240 RepID=A0A495JW00_9ACTN|nr:hypothetical protein [Micromonospora pisi]RKR92758.1 hypothetical protein BDK92_7238 [Micromonospora pisi]
MSPDLDLAVYVVLAVASGVVWWMTGRAARRAYDQKARQQGGRQ